MPKFYVHRTQPAYVTEVVKIEAETTEEAEIAVIDGEGDTIGLSCGDYLDAYHERIEIFAAASHNLPTGFLPINGEELQRQNADMLALRDAAPEMMALLVGLLKPGSVNSGVIESGRDLLARLGHDVRAPKAEGR